MIADTLPPPTHSPPPTSLRPRLREFALAAVATLLDASEPADGLPELQFLRQHRQHLSDAGEWHEILLPTFQTPARADTRLLDLAGELALSPLEILAVALAAAVEDDALVGRALARVQAPVGGARPTLGLLATAFAPMLAENESAFATLLNGAAIQTGLLTLLNETAPVPERAVAVPTPICLVLAGHDSVWPGATVGLDATSHVALPESTLVEAARRAEALAADSHGALLIRAGSMNESRAVAKKIAQALDRQAVFVETDKLNGFGPWLTLRGLLPVFTCELGPSERRVLPPLPGYSGPMLALTGPDGGVETTHGAMPVWTLPVPPVSERAILWRSALGDSTGNLADNLARHHRHSAGRIAHLARSAGYHRMLRVNSHSDEARSIDPPDIMAAAWTTEGGGLHSLAEPLRAPVSDEALVTPPALRANLDLLLLRCRNRDGLIEGLGPAATTRYRPGVKALFTGPSGTGKTLAAGWLATRLGMPLYRVDLASVTSKYIGETEKNLAQLLARAEQSEVILLFDEADSLFGKRTDIRDSNDRFANAQTNYLLQRIESYDGIVVLTSNSKSRFDSAFARRLDCVLEFPLPSPDERRALWRAHLGERHVLSPAELNQLAALADIAGGHIRNAVLTAALLARDLGCKITLADCVSGLESEYRKLGRQIPTELRDRRVTRSEQLAPDD